MSSKTIMMNNQFSFVLFMLLSGACSAGWFSISDTSFLKATLEGDFATVKKYIDAGSDVNKPKDSAGSDGLGRAINYGGKESDDAQLKTVKLLIAAKADVNLLIPVVKGVSDAGGSPLMEALHWKRYEIAQLLIDAKADVNMFQKLKINKFVTIQGSNPLVTAVIEQDLVAVKFLIAAGAKPDILTTAKSPDRCPLFLAVSQAKDGTSIKILESLLSVNKINVNIQDKDEMTPLINAVYMRYKKMVEMLLAAGADPNIIAWKSKENPKGANIVTLFNAGFGKENGNKHDETIGSMLQAAKEAANSEL